MPQPPPEVAVAQKLPAIALEGIAGGPNTLDGKVGRLEFLDQPVPGGAFDTAVEAARDHRRPVLDWYASLKVDLGAIGAMSFDPGGQNSAVNLRPHAEAP